MAIDVDGNGRGEYGFLGELSGAVPVRWFGPAIAPPLLPPPFGNVVASRVTRQGYVFQMGLSPKRESGVWHFQELVRRAYAQSASGSSAIGSSGS